MGVKEKVEEEEDRERRGKRGVGEEKQQGGEGVSGPICSFLPQDRVH